MLPSSSSQLAARCGHLNHYKKFWLLQSTQLDKQDHTSNNPSLISLQGSPSNCIINPAAPCNKDTTSKPLLIPSSHHAAIATTHQHANSCRGAVDMAATFGGSGSINSSSRFTIGVCNSNEPSSACVSTSHFMNVQRYVGHEAAVLSMGRDDGPRLSLAVNCGSTPVDAPVKSAKEESWRLSTTRCQQHSFVPSEQQLAQVMSESLASHDEKCDSSESSLEVEKRGWSIPPIYQGSPATSTALLRNFMHDELAHEAKIVPTKFRGSNLPLSYVDRMGTSSSAPLSSSGSPRSCTLCGTTKTPLWRSGPDGPKSLCNACGIRVKKTKRLEASLQATATSGSCSLSPTLSGNVHKGAFKRKLSTSKEPCNLQKKRRRVAFPSKGNIHMTPLLFKHEVSCDHSNFSGKLDFATPKLAQLVPHNGRDPAKTFAKDVEEAAVMLMALSCGLVLS